MKIWNDASQWVKLNSTSNHLELKCLLAYAKYFSSIFPVFLLPYILHSDINSYLLMVPAEQVGLGLMQHMLR